MYEVWYELSEEERKNVVMHIVDILKSINKTKNHSFLHSKYIRNDLILLYQKAFNTNISILENKGLNVVFLKAYSKKRIPIIFEECKLGLVYNDAHFDNFIYDGKSVKLIDFDRVLYTSIDYELLILNTMVNNPTKFANERVEPFVKLDDYKEILPIIRNEYPELSNFKHLDERLFIYTFFYTLGNIYTFDLFEMLPQVLVRFEERFSNDL